MGRTLPKDCEKCGNGRSISVSFTCELLASFRFMDTLQRSALLSIVLHALVGGCLLWSPVAKQRPIPPISRPMMVDFVKVGPRSGAPKLGPGGTLSGGRPSPKAEAPKKATTHQPKKALPKKEMAKSNTAKKDVQTKGKDKPVAVKPSTKQPAKKSAKPATSSKNGASKPAAKKAPSAKSSGSTKKTAPTKTTRAKVDLTPQKKQASSVGSLLGAGSGEGAMAETYAEELTGTEMDLLNQHMKRFWNMPSGHEKASELVVEVELFIRPDGRIERALIVDEARFRKDPEFRLAAECALRAVLDPECSPLPLSPERYESWKHMIFVFDPREMCR